MEGAVAIVLSLLLIRSNAASAKLTFAEAVEQQRERVVHYTNTWAVRVLGGDEVADALAARHGLINRGQVKNNFSYIQLPMLCLNRAIISKLIHYYTRTNSLSKQQFYKNTSP